MVNNLLEILKVLGILVLILLAIIILIALTGTLIQTLFINPINNKKYKKIKQEALKELIKEEAKKDK